MTCPRCSARLLLHDEDPYCLCGYRENVAAEGLEDPEEYPEDNYWNFKIQGYHRPDRSPQPGRVCEICGAGYTPSYHHQRTCGRACGKTLSLGKMLRAG